MLSGSSQSKVWRRRCLKWMLPPLLFVVIALGICCLFLFYQHTNTYEFEEFSKIYTITRFTKNGSSIGFVRIPSKIFKNDELVSFRSKNGEIFSVVLESPEMSSGDYYCYGTCFCGENSESRRNVNSKILTKSLYFVISAISLTLAVKISSSYFSEQCVHALKDICPKENIDSEIDYCVSKGDKEFEEEELEFHCSGHCTKNEALRVPRTKEASEEFKCENYSMEKKVKVKTSARVEKTWENFHSAQLVFLKDHLVPYCRFISVYDYKYVSINGRKRKTWNRQVSLCVGTSTKIRRSNVCCYLIERKCKSHGSK